MTSFFRRGGRQEGRVPPANTACSVENWPKINETQEVQNKLLYFCKKKSKKFFRDPHFLILFCFFRVGVLK
jgi:hypothetical protein